MTGHSLAWVKETNSWHHWGPRRSLPVVRHFQAFLRGQGCLPREKRAAQHSFFPLEGVRSCSGVLPNSSLGMSSRRMFFSGSLSKKLWFQENFQVTSRNFASVARSLLWQAALECARHPLPPSAAAQPRLGSQPCPRLHCGGRSTRGRPVAAGPTPRPRSSHAGPRCAQAGELLCVRAHEEEIPGRVTHISVSKSRA